MTQAYLTRREVLGHIDLLVDEGRVGQVEDDGVVRFTAARSTARRPPSARQDQVGVAELVPR